MVGLLALSSSLSAEGMPGQSLGIATVPNLRDLGGYKAANGMMTRMGILYRSNQLSRIDKGDLAKIAALGLKNEYDLRTAGERSALPDELPAGVNNIWLDVLDDASDSAPAQLLKLLNNPPEANKVLGGGKVEAMFTAAYRQFVSLPSARKAYRRLFIDLTKQENLPALFHCTTGKDRTGWAAAALLALLGIPEDVIYTDFLKSNDYLLPAYEPTIEAFRKGGGDPEIIKAVLGVKSEYLQASFDEMRRKYGTIEDYFSKALGIDAVGQTALRDVFLSRAN
ncbi:hypothetical protein B5V01_11080 [Mesorhizobium erdmanii]|uniref:Protein-tyrosine-phosphatase n=2 Tax=Mesorhizobium TaxID=68287 RepID=A0A3M9XEF0_9HYPH|nr:MULTISPECIES: tyrosine-protein phosphatase [Mesorhizobium]RNJ46271.1 protein-tyrosine-phosphatase [Mesorhizobium japonicum]RXT47603.1 hypothetical protein B5V01_11080 [Mesorhizobium erdmanii]